MKISILTPSFNSANYLERAIKSVLNQGYDDFEHIIVDGFSTDGTIEILKKYTHLKWISEKDNGQSDAMNKAFKMSTGELIVYLNADDELEENAFKNVIGEFNHSPEIHAVLGNLNCKNGEHVNFFSCSTSLDDIVNINNDLCFPLNPVAYYYRREVQQKIGDFPEEEHFAMDCWFLFRMYKDFNLKYLNVTLGTYHITGENKSMDFLKSRTALVKVLRDFFCEFNLKQYNFILDEFTFKTLEQVNTFTTLYTDLKIQQSSLKYLLKRVYFLLKLKFKKR